MHWYFIPFHYQTIAPCTDGYSTWMDIVLSIHEWVDIWALMLFGYPEWATVNICVEICVCTLWFLLAMSLGVELLGHMVITLLRNCQPVSKVLQHFYSVSSAGAPSFLHSCQHCLLDCCPCVGMKCFLMSWICISSMVLMLSTCHELLPISLSFYLLAYCSFPPILYYILLVGIAVA